jgi:UDPglucose 6-dehydrogenase
MKISIIGTGYVGLVTGACFAELGHDVLCMDDNPEKIAILKAGKVPIYEPGLDSLIESNVEEGRLSFTQSMKDAVQASELLFICVGTPPKPSGEADLSAVEAVGKRIGEYLNGYKLIVEKSTVPVQTARWLEKTIRESQQAHGHAFDVASNPEFLREGSAIHDFLHPDRIVLGVSSQQAASRLVELYEPLNAPLLITDIESAELIKHASNAFLAMKISFINAVARICEKTGADVVKVAKGIGLDSRIGTAFLQAGIGYGGSCFPKDVSAFVHLAEELGYDFKLLKAVEEVNKAQRLLPLEKLKKNLGDLKGKTISVWGLSFKPNTDDLREAPSIAIIQNLLKEGARVKAFDPASIENAKKLLPATQVYYAHDPYDAVVDSHAILLATEWPLFKKLNFLKVKKLMRNPLLIDGRNLFDPMRMRNLGFQYDGIGRGIASLVQKNETNWLEAGKVKR